MQLLMVSATTTGASQQIHRRCVERGIELILLTDDPDRFAGVFSSDLRVVRAELDVASLCAAARGLRDVPHRQQAMLTTADPHIIVAAQASHELALPGPDVRHVSRYSSKAAQKRQLQRAGIDTPPFHEYLRDDWCDTATGTGLADITFPVVVKPDLGSASAGVKLCGDPATTGSHVAQLFFQSSARHTDSVLVEAYVPGIELCVELFDGVYLGAIRKQTESGASFIERGYVAGSGLSQARELALAAVCEAAVEALGFTWGPVHIDCIIDESRIVVVEVNARLAGSFIPRIMRDAYGVDMADCLISAAFGEKRPVRRNPQAAHVRADFVLVNDYAPASLFGTPRSFSTELVYIEHGRQINGSRERVGYCYTIMRPDDSVVPTHAAWG